MIGSLGHFEFEVLMGHPGGIETYGFGVKEV